MLNLSRGYKNFKFSTNVVPFSTIRGAASLDWTKRPGNYVQSNSVIKGEVRCAVPIQNMLGLTVSDKVYSRVVFVMDYRDSDLFHVIEDTEGVGIAPSIPASRASHQSSDGVSEPDFTVAPSHSTLSVVPEGGLSKSRNQSLHSRPSNDAHEEPVRRVSYGSGERDIYQMGEGVSGRSRVTELSGAASKAVTTGNLSNRASYTGGGGGLKCSPSWLPQLATFQPPPAPEIKEQKGVGVNWASSSPPPAPEIKEQKGVGVNWASSSVCSSQLEPEDPPTEAELKLEAAMVDIDRIEVDMKLLQSLSTTKLTPEQASDRELDLLTGFHLVDGKERMIVLEGMDESYSMGLSIIDWALEDEVPEEEEPMRKRLVVYNSAVRYPTRLWASLGVDLYITKLRSSLTKISAEAGSYATGKVRADCIRGLRKLYQLRTCSWARLADDLCMFPLPDMIHLVDKKFGGELTKADVYGVEVDEFDSDDEDGGSLGMVDGGGDGSVSDDSKSKGSYAKSARSGRSGRSGKSRKSRKGKANKAKSNVRKHPAPMPVEHINYAYMRMREEARQRRLELDYLKTNVEMLDSLATMSQPLRDAWATWNPQRKAAKDLEASVKAGTVTLEETMDAHKPTRDREIIPGTISMKESMHKGWYPHQGPFRWPIPKEPGTYAAMAKKPSDFRVEQLADQWVEGEMFEGLQARPAEPGLLPMITTVKNPTGQFNLDPEFVKTIHSGGKGREKELAEDKQKEKLEWHSKLVVDTPIMKVTLPLRPKPSQTDRMNHILQDDPKKKGFKISHVPADTTTLHQNLPYVELPPVPNLRGDAKGRIDKNTFTLPGTNFAKDIAKDKRAISKPNLNQSWKASLKDSRYHENP
eukprot:gene18236-24687_t